MDDVRFERAVNRLKDLDLVATLDMFDHLTAQMIDRFGWAARTSAVANQAARFPAAERRDPVSEDLRAQIVRDNELEAEFYSIAAGVTREHMGIG